MLDKDLINIVEQIKSTSSGNMISTAESCTGGLLAAYLTSIPGASSFFHSGIVSYANEAKSKLLNVQESTIAQYGAVSEEVAREMAVGCKNNLGSNIAISITGIAGPGGGTIEKPVGMVCFATAYKREVAATTQHLKGDREQIRLQACKVALNMILTVILKG